VAELLPEFSFSEYAIDDRLSRLRWLTLDPKADLKLFRVGSYVLVGAANSLKFYALQDITGPEFQSQLEDLHMRQQMFQVASIDGKAKTLTLNRPLEFDLPVDSTSDGSNVIFDRPYPSKVTPLTVIEGVGFEDFSLVQDMSGLPALNGSSYFLQPFDAVQNYGNLAPEYAMHGIEFKWVVNSWARRLQMSMTGSHPIVSEVASNLQIEQNSFDGAWNKGKGGNGYLRGSRVWHSLYAYNVSRNLRHFTFQWSASGNVAFGNDLDSDLNLHGGWERYNLFERNVVRVPYEHRASNCRSNCGDEAGDVEEGTWYPFWWAAGRKAVKWSGSSGPQNVFYHNTLSKQLTKGGPFISFKPYSTDSPDTELDTVYQFGSDNFDPRFFRHLSQGGSPIPDWSGRETLDYSGQGVVKLADRPRPSLFLRNPGAPLPPPPSGCSELVFANNTFSAEHVQSAQLATTTDSTTLLGDLRSYFITLQFFRNQISSGAPINPTVPDADAIRDGSGAAPDEYFEVLLRPTGVRLVFRRTNGYLVGFYRELGPNVHSRTFFSLRGGPNDPYGVPSVDPGAQLSALAFYGTYGALENRSGTSRSELTFSTDAFQQHARALACPTSPEADIARALMFYVVALSEAARFESIADMVRNGLIGPAPTSLDERNAYVIFYWRNLTNRLRSATSPGALQRDLANRPVRIQRTVNQQTIVVFAIATVAELIRYLAVGHRPPAGGSGGSTLLAQPPESMQQAALDPVEERDPVDEKVVNDGPEEP
jgi:Ribosome inactivating protein